MAKDTNVGNLYVGIEGNASGLNREIAGVQLKATNAFKKVGSVASGMVTGAAIAAVAAIAVGLTAGVKAAIDFEKAFAGVRKTLDGSPEELKAVADELLDISRNLPQSAAELAGIAQVAGQLGVAAKDVAAFTEVVAKLAGATDLVGETGATSMARFMKVIGQPIENTEAFAAVLVDLGNNMAATESEIIMLAQNFGALGTQVGLSGEEILAFSAAMREMGQPAAAGATALNKLFTQLNRAMLGEGGLAEVADIAGMSMFEFQELMETSMAAAANAVLDGLNAMNEAGRDQIAVLDEVGLSRDRVSRALITLAKNETGRAKAMEVANEQMKLQNALNEEFEKRQDTVAGQVEILKSNFNSFAVQLGEFLLPVIRKVVDFISRFMDGLHFLMSLFKNLGPVMQKVSLLITSLPLFKFLQKIIGAVTNLIKRFFGLGKAVEEGAKKMGFFGKILKKFGLDKFFGGGMVAGFGLAITGIAELGDLQQKIDDFAGGVDNLTKKFGVLNSHSNTVADGLKKLTDEDLKLFIEGMEEGALKETLTEMFEGGRLDSDTVRALHDTGAKISDELMQGMKDQFGVGEAGGTFGFDKKAIEGFIQDLEEAGITEGAIYENLIAQRGAIATGYTATKKALQDELVALLAIQEAQGAQIPIAEQIRDILKANAADLGFTEEQIDKSTRSMDQLRAFTEKYGLTLEGIPSLYELLFPAEQDPVQVALQQLKEDAAAFKEMINDVFAPTEAQFELQFAEMDLADAHKEHADLHAEIGNLHEEDAQLQQDLLDLQKEELLTHEEKLKIAELNLEIQELQNKHANEAAMTFEEQVEQQNLINEALEIEDRLRRGLSLSANDQLRREKLRKDLRRVELAAAQGSLEFADLEAQAIKENIAQIEAGAVSETDAILKRRKAADIAAKADLRREKEKEEILKNQKEINELNLEATVRRNEEIMEIEKRRIEIEERLAEIPREIKEAHYDIHKAQKEVMNRTADIQIGFMKMRAVSEIEMKALAEAIGMPTKELDGLMTLLNHARVESGEFIEDILKRVEVPSTEFIPGSQSDTQRKAYSQLQSLPMGRDLFLRHSGGSFKPGQNYMVGELGPELLKAFPGGGGMISPLGQRGQGGGGNVVNLNISGLPSDPIAARKVAQTIQRELNKLEREGRSGVIR